MTEATLMYEESPVLCGGRDMDMKWKQCTQEACVAGP